jgi:glycosyltransferase involved in cell wall biosynthesis
LIGQIGKRPKESWGPRLKNFFTRKRAPAATDIRIDLYATCWNEERMIPFFLRHYEPLVDRMIIYDDGSTDRSLELLAASPKVELRRLPQGDSYVLVQTEEMNQCWKESRGRADWVFICDMDEQLYHKELRTYLAKCQEAGVTILNPVGLDMVSAYFPPPKLVLTESVRLCVRAFLQDKLAVFNPNAIDEINYTPGRHLASPTGRVIFPHKRDVKLLHYKQLGLDYLLLRSKEMQSRTTKFDRDRGWASHYDRSAEDIRTHFEKMLSEAMDMSLIGKKKTPVLPAEKSSM